MDVKSAKKPFVAISSRFIQYNAWTMLDLKAKCWLRILRQKNQIEAETYIIIIVIIYESSSTHAEIDV